MNARKKSDVAFVLAFLAAITIPMVMASNPDWLDHAWFEKIEKRVPAPFPDWGTRKSFRNFAADFEAYFDDHLGLRAQLIKLRNRSELVLLNKSSTPLVILGEDHWLFIRDGGSDEEFLGLKPFTPRQLSRMRAAIEQRHQWLAARGIKYIFLIAPDKQTIYPEKLPRALRRDPAPTRTTQFLEYMRGSPAEESLVFAAQAIVAAKREGDLYYRSDTHWNLRGAYAAYRAAAERLAPGEIQTLTIDQKDIADGDAPDGPRGGDLAIMLNINFMETPPQPAPLNISRPRCAIPVTPAVVEGTSSLPEHEFAWECPSSLGQRAVLFHDSFGWSLLPFFAESFSQIRSSHRYPTFEDIVKYVETDRPTVVIEEHVERNLPMLAL